MIVDIRTDRGIATDGSEQFSLLIARSCDDPRDVGWISVYWSEEIPPPPSRCDACGVSVDRDMADVSYVRFRRCLCRACVPQAPR
jgi:hypothetical protein